MTHPATPLALPARAGPAPEAPLRACAVGLSRSRPCRDPPRRPPLPWRVFGRGRGAGCCVVGRHAVEGTGQHSLLDTETDRYLNPHQACDEPGVWRLAEKETSHLSGCFDKLTRHWRRPELGTALQASFPHPTWRTQIGNQHAGSASEPRARLSKRGHCTLHTHTAVTVMPL